MVSVYCVVDNTSSMGEACTAAKVSAAELMTLGSLVAGEPCVTIGVIGDYSTGSHDGHQGGYALLRPLATGRHEWFNKYMHPAGGGGSPEAYKTALNFLLREKPGILMLFLDDEPHMAPLDSEGKKEYKFLRDNQMITDWGKLCEAVKRHGFQVVTFVTGYSRSKIRHHYEKLGCVIEIDNNSSSVITSTMMTRLCEMLGGLLNLEDCMNKADPGFVLDAFDALLDTNKPEQAMCITTNPILGKYWRKICGVYREAHQDKCQIIMDKLSQIKNKLSKGEDISTLKKWIDESHNQTDVIQSIIAKSTFEEAYILPVNHSIKLDDVLELGRGGNFRELAHLIAEVQLVKRSDCKNDDQKFIVRDMPLNTMRMLAHLLSPGLLFSKTVAMFAAILALPNAHLEQDARALLRNNMGNWINWELDEKKEQRHPVFWSHHFIRLLRLCPDKYLTPNEISFRDKYLLVANLIRNHDALIDLKVPILISGLRRDVTRKRMCPRCKIARCFTVFPGDSTICGHCIQMDPSCIYYDETMSMHALYKLETDPKKFYEVSDTETHWAQCRTCHSNYGVASASIPVAPKCYNCRHGLEPETVACCMCLHKYQNPGNSAMIAMQQDDPIFEMMTDFVCPRCAIHPETMVSEIKTKISDFFHENPSFRSLVPVNDYDKLMNNSVKLWKRVSELDVICEEKKLIEFYSEQFHIFDDMVYKGLTVHKPAEVEEQIFSILTTHQSSACCMLCLDTEVELRNIVPSCGHCQNRICKNCVKAWYSQASIGEIVSENHTKCCFCKQSPSFETVKHFQLRHFLKHAKTCDWDPKFVYACCTQCVHLKICGEKSCMADATEMVGFVCSDCKKPVQLLDAPVTKPCPNCTATTQHTGGCNHMSCVCGAHWCWHCGQNSDQDTIFTARNIYDHMSECGGIFPNA